MIFDFSRQAFQVKKPALLFFFSFFSPLLTRGEGAPKPSEGAYVALRSSNLDMIWNRLRSRIRGAGNNSVEFQHYNRPDHRYIMLLFFHCLRDPLRWSYSWQYLFFVSHLSGEIQINQHQTQQSDYKRRLATCHCHETDIRGKLPSAIRFAY